MGDKKSSLRRAKELRQLVLSDELTNLYNRRYLMKRLEEERRKAGRQGGVFSLMFMDVDNFKGVNDTHGHLCGDKVLVEIGRILQSSVRDIDVVCRYAGDEFVVILPDAEEEESSSIAERIRTSVAEHSWAESDIPISKATLSIGLSFYPRDATGLTGLIEKADQALYLAKRRGRNLFCSAGELEAEQEMVQMVRPAPVSRFVGREQELGKMRELIERCSKGEGRLALTRGEAGIGKTRFVNELKDKGLLTDFALLFGSCYEETRSIPYFPFREACARFLKVEEDGLKHYKNLREAYRDELRKIIPQIEGVPQVEYPPDEYRFFEAVRSLFAEISRERPLFLFLDDLHWADEASLNLLHYLARGVRKERMLICGTFREEELADTGGEKSALAQKIDLMARDNLFSSISLGCLSERDISLLIDSLFPDVNVPDDLKELIYSRAEGNPFFAEELLRALEDELSQKGFDAEEVAKVLKKAALPASVSGVIEWRMDRLDEKAKQILACAALLGKEFSFDILLRLAEVNEGHLLDVMDSASKVHLIREDPLSGGDRFRFHHSLTADVLYQGMSGPRRRSLHGMAGEVMESYYGKKKEDVAEELARHFWEGGSYEKAAHYAKIAGDRAMELYGNDEAIDLYTRALQALDRTEEAPVQEEFRFDILNGRQMVYDILGRRESQKADLAQMIRVATRLGDRKRLSDGFMCQSGFHILAGEYSLAREFAEKALAVKKEIGDRAGEGDALRKLGMVYADLGENQRALEHHQAALKIQMQIGDKRGEGMTLFSTGIVWYNLGEYQKALGSYEQSLRIFRGIGDRRMEGAALCNIGVGHSLLGDYKEALRCYTAHLDISRKLGDRRMEAADLHNIGILKKDSGTYEEALDYCQQALEINRETGNRREEGNCLGDIGTIYDVLGYYQQALKYHEEALKIQREIGNKDAEGRELTNLGGVYESLGNYEKALQFQKGALSLGEETGSKYLIVEGKNSLSKIYIETGGEDEFQLALKHSREATKLSEEIGLSNGEIQGLSNQGMAYLSLGNMSQALRYSKRATSLLEKKGQMEGSEEEIYFNHYRLLRTKGDKKGTRDYLKKAYDELMGKARRIKDRKLRNSFLKKVKLNKEIAEEWGRVTKVGVK